MTKTYPICPICGLRITEKHAPKFYNLYEHPHCKSKVRNHMSKNLRKRESKIKRKYHK